MRKVCRLAREVLDIAAREVRPGITTDYLDEVVHKACLERNVGNFLKFQCIDIPNLSPRMGCSNSDFGRSSRKFTVVPFAIELLPFPKICMHLGK